MFALPPSLVNRLEEGWPQAAMIAERALAIFPFRPGME
jgi:hypothetical protein